MSKERARRRAAREHEAALRSAARAAEAGASGAHGRPAPAVRAAATTGRLPRLPRPAARPGTLARRRRVQTSLVLAVLVALNVLVWVVRPDWAGPAGGAGGQRAGRARPDHPAGAAAPLKGRAQKGYGRCREPGGRWSYGW